jgi:hypothetical protein
VAGSVEDGDVAGVWDNRLRKSSAAAQAAGAVIW